jgi:Leucine-rich repeat (LRR) protein
MHFLNKHFFSTVALFSIPVFSLVFSKDASGTGKRKRESPPDLSVRFVSSEAESRLRITNIAQSNDIITQPIQPETIITYTIYTLDGYRQKNEALLNELQRRPDLSQRVILEFLGMPGKNLSLVITHLLLLRHNQLYGISLNLYDFSINEVKDLNSVLKNFTNLQQLDLSMDPDAVTPIQESLQNLKNLHSLSLSFSHKLKETEVNILVSALENHKEIRSLKLRSFSGYHNRDLPCYEDTVVKKVIEVFQGLKHLQYLHLNALWFRDSGTNAFAQALGSLAELQQLTIRCIEFSTTEAKTLGQALRHLTKLQKFSITQMPSSTREGDSLDTVKALTEMLRFRPHFQCLDLSSNNFAAEGAKESQEVIDLLEAIVNLDCLLALDLSDNWDREDESKYVITPEDLEATKKLVTKRKERVNALAVTLPKLAHLKRLSLASNQFRQEELVTLAQSLASLSGLQSLDLHGLFFSEEGVPVVIQLLRGLKKLTDIDLAYNSLKALAVVEIGSSLRNHKHIKWLSFYDNAYSEEENAKEILIPFKNHLARNNVDVLLDDIEDPN